MKWEAARGSILKVQHHESPRLIPGSPQAREKFWEGVASSQSPDFDCLEWGRSETSPDQRIFTKPYHWVTSWTWWLGNRVSWRKSTTGQIAFRYIGEYRGSIANHPCKSWSSSTFGAQKLRSLSQAWYSWRWLPDIRQWLCHTLVNPSLLWDSPLIPVTPWYMPIPLLHLVHFPNKVLLIPRLPDEDTD